MEKPTWTIVQFSEDNTVEAVPSTWIEHNKCYWPPFKNEKVIAAIRKNAERNTCWPCYDIITFWNSTYDDYNIARRKTKKAEDTSDLNSSEVDTKRKRIKNRLYENKTDDEQCNIARAPTKRNKIIQSSSEESEESDSVLPKHPQMTDTLIKITSLSIQNFHFIVFYFMYINISWETHGVYYYFYCCYNIIEKILMFYISDLLDVLKTGQVAMQQDNNNCVNPEIENNSFLTNSMRCTCQLCPAHDQMQNKNEKYFKQIIRQQNYFKAQLWQTFEDIQDIKNTGLNPAPNNDVQKQESVFCSFTLPLETEQQLQEVEQFLTNQNNFKAS
ncbi:uncharacterized protein, partial [Temnothorax nylanderi]|uniref:uncharacterized protein n=1 Tax=Temnothorax nylanderi TaxID=102681 RepID=UPI003A88BB0D